ncbi:PREDICTED: probable long-chain-alcohol O-fatty-acyltransferase 1 [Tarenaya hassleriana]|uniref:probable long-chain-alcohol O-fatty-acyltransferase 1 n=1 Tax=Tarenaya hassleriana TaxID=28532 RepID=UPI00053CAA62|nr:PREDICTED: probable long-chain-alcohol O-fatty-acyltransferase 1 [Tarenaya hassleriana]
MDGELKNLVKPKQNPPGQNPSSDGISNLDPSKKSMPRWVLAVKVVIFGILLRVYDHTENLPRFVVLAIYCLHTYLEIELVLVFVGSTVSSFLGCEIEPVFNEPYLATSLQDFWSRRWNLMVPAVLRPTVHVPVQRASVRVVGPMWSVLLGVVASFLVSGLMHELIYFYMIRLPPTWEVTLFFVLNGFCTAAEILVKRRVVRWRLHRSVSGPITLGFVSVTGVWLFFPQVLRNGLHDRVINEWLWAIDLVKSKLFSSP